MSITVVGSIAFDTVKTPFGERERMLGGTAVHFSLASSFFADVHVVGPVGEDFGEAEMARARARRGVHTRDVERVAGGKTFFWRGALRLRPQHRARPTTRSWACSRASSRSSRTRSRACDVLFLANIQPELQLGVREQCDRARFVALDSMNLWIDTARDSLAARDRDRRLRAAQRRRAAHAHRQAQPRQGRARAVTRLGTGRRSSPSRASTARRWSRASGFFALPAYPLETVLDPTGAGDTFAGGFVGTLAAHAGRLDDELLRRAMAHGTTLASFNVEEFGTERVSRLTHSEIDARVRELREMTRFSGLPLPSRG